MFDDMCVYLKTVCMFDVGCMCLISGCVYVRCLVVSMLTGCMCVLMWGYLRLC